MTVMATTRPATAIAILRSLTGRCPACGRGKLFKSYIRQVDACESCKEPLGHLRADDAPPWLTILVVGHIVVPLAYWIEREHELPEWVSMTLWPTLAMLLVAIILPRAKGVFLAILWSTGAPGSEKD